LPGKKIFSGQLTDNGQSATTSRPLRGAFLKPPVLLVVADFLQQGCVKVSVTILHSDRKKILDVLIA